MTKSKQNTACYLIIDTNNLYYIRKYLSKVQEVTSINQNTLSKHFNNSNEPYKNDKFEVIKVQNVDLDSNNKGNKYNFSNSSQEYE